MNRIESLSIAAALGLGSVVGFAGARWARPDTVEKGERAQRTESSATTTAARTEAEEANARTQAGSEVLAAILADELQSRRLVALDRYCAGLDVEAARSAVASLPDDGSPNVGELRSRLLSRWAEFDPSSAAAFALRMNGASYRGGPLLDVLKVWASQDAKAAERFVAGMKRDEHDLTLHYFTRSLAERDLEEAFQFASSLPASAKRSALYAAFQAAGDRNPSAAAARALAIPPGELRDTALASVTSVWVQKNPQAAVAWAKERPDLPVAHGGTLLPFATGSWTSYDPAAASVFALSLPAGKQRDEMIGSVAASWARRDFARAEEWVTRLPEDAAKTRALESLARGLQWDNPSAAAAFLARQPAGAKTNETLDTIGQQWSRTDPEGALAWAAAQPNEGFEKSIAAQALGALAGDDPARAVEGLAALRSAESRAAAITEIARGWAERDPQVAARWVLELPEADASRAALQAAVEQGSWRDPAAMADWLGTMKGHPQRDVAVAAFVRAAGNFDPVIAATWANTVADAETRRPLVREMVRGIVKFDPPAAREWVLGQNLEAAERKALLDLIDRQAKPK